MNKIILTGRLVRDIELKKSESGNSYVNYTLAVRRDSDNTDFIDCISFGVIAEKLNEYIKKGDMICISGSLQVSTYEKDDNKHTKYTVVSERVEFLGGKNKVEESKVESGVKSDTFELNDDDLPF